MEFLLKPDFGKVDRNVFLNALGQSFYSMSIGMGCICTYASYFSRQTNLFKSALQISVIDLLVAVLAGLMIFPAAFSVGISPDSGPSLIFITLPNVFNKAFAALPVLGWIISLLFYVLLSVAALTSLMSLHEVNTSFFYEELKIDRKKGDVYKRQPVGSPTMARSMCGSKGRARVMPSFPETSSSAEAR